MNLLSIKRCKEKWIFQVRTILWNQKNNMNWNWIPNISLGNFEFGETIDIESIGYDLTFFTSLTILQKEAMCFKVRVQVLL